MLLLFSRFFPDGGNTAFPLTIFCPDPPTPLRTFTLAIRKEYTVTDSFQDMAMIGSKRATTRCI